ncbi:MAG: hypothetical protein HN855_14110 [Anaerolineae bacterium]|jgi:hypothetical protein|nr:hypothetical protein [Anaerolineae bacterium]MBT7070662.1 hypothetical protein [Anaerolineae bacterium]MBT7326290.1 hypothetical protein [Anaerolineae bacterium]
MEATNTLLEKLKNPIVAAAVAIVVGFALGLSWGWIIQPVEFVDATPDVLRADYQQDYLRMTVDSLLVNSDTTLALRRWENLGAAAQSALEGVRASSNAQERVAVDGFEKLVSAATPSVPSPETGAEPDPKTGTNETSTFKYVLIFVGIVVIAAVGFFAMRVLRPLSSPKDGETTPAQQAQKINKNAQQTDYEEMGLATPITQSMTTYVLGDDLYDESFSIESQAGEFMGEYGVGISDTIGVGDPKKVTALEIWLFDKNDIKTATKVLMSEHAYNDPAIRQRLEAKGELVLVKANEPVRLQTETLQLLVTIADLEYGSGPLPANSYFDRATLELAVWPKSNG